MALRGAENLTGSLDGPRPAEKGLKPGLYQIVAELPVTAPGRQPTTTLRAESGFSLRARHGKGGRLTALRAIIRGMGNFSLFRVRPTWLRMYTGDSCFNRTPGSGRRISRRCAAGVNLVRTGIWTGWKEHSDGEGRPQESVLRALEVFLLTARAHDIPVIFTLFRFRARDMGRRQPLPVSGKPGCPAAFRRWFRFPPGGSGRPDLGSDQRALLQFP